MRAAAPPDCGVAVGVKVLVGVRVAVRVRVGTGVGGNTGNVKEQSQEQAALEVVKLTVTLFPLMGGPQTLKFINVWGIPDGKLTTPGETV